MVSCDWIPRLAAGVAWLSCPPCMQLGRVPRLYGPFSFGIMKATTALIGLGMKPNAVHIFKVSAVHSHAASPSKVQRLT